MEKKVALSIAGSDPSGGAGIQADIKSFSYLNIHGLTAVTCVTSQNTRQVKQIYKLPIDLIENQSDILFDDFKVDAVKTGMLYDEETIKLVSKKIDVYEFKPIVDPVMVATSGDNLSENNIVKSIKFVSAFIFPTSRIAVIFSSFLHYYYFFSKFYSQIYIFCDFSPQFNEPSPLNQKIWLFKVFISNLYRRILYVRGMQHQ